MQKILSLPQKIITGLAIVSSVAIAFFSLVAWMAAREAVVFVTPLVIYAMAIFLIASGLVTAISFGVVRFKWLDIKWAELNRDKSLASNEARQANIASDRAQMHLVAEGRLMAAAVRQVETGLIHPSVLGEGAKFSSFPSSVINQVNSAVPLLEAKAPQPLPNEVDLWSLIPTTGPSINNLILGIEKTDSGLKPLTSSLTKLVHIGVGGSSGWGKTVFLQCLAIQIALAPELAQMALIDIEGQTFSPFSKLGYDKLRYPLADNETSILAILDDLRGEWEHRRELFQKYPEVSNLGEYNNLADEALAPLVMMIDEVNMLTNDKDIMDQLVKLGQGTRKYGIYCVLGGQDWNATSIPTKLRNNFSTRIQLKALSKSQSRVMLEDSAAADIKELGRAYAILPGRGVSEIQTPLIEKAEITKALAAIPQTESPLNMTDRIEQKVIDCYLETGSYNPAYRCLYELENNEPYTGGKLTTWHRNKVKAILDKNSVQHPLKAEKKGE